MSQPTTTEQLTATQYVVPVQSLQGLPKLAKATTTPPPVETVKRRLPWGEIVVVSAIWGCVIWLAVDLAYGGFDKRAAMAELNTAKQEAAQLQIQNAELQQLQQHQQQAINNAAAALGCPVGGSHQ